VICTACQYETGDADAESDPGASSGDDISAMLEAFKHAIADDVRKQIDEACTKMGSTITAQTASLVTKLDNAGDAEFEAGVRVSPEDLYACMQRFFTAWASACPVPPPDFSNLHSLPTIPDFPFPCDPEDNIRAEITRYVRNADLDTLRMKDVYDHMTLAIGPLTDGDRDRIKRVATELITSMLEPRKR